MDHVVEHVLFRVTVHGVHPHLTLDITNQMVMALIAGLLMLLIFPRLFNSASGDVPTGARNFFESIIEFLRIEVFRPALKEHTDRFAAYLWTLFFFLLFCNLLGLIPFATFFELITVGHARDFGGTATGNIWNTAALAVLAFVMIHVSGVLQVFRDLVRGTYGHHEPHEEHSSNGAKSHEAAMDLEHMRGEALAADVPQQFTALGDPTHHYADGEHPRFGGHVAVAHGALHHHAGMNPVVAAIIAIPLYIWNFAPHPFRPAEGEPSWKWAMDIPMWLMLLILELLGAFIKPFALSIRLFANMIAGHLVLAALLTLIVLSSNIAVQLAVGVPVALLCVAISVLEVFVAFLQAYIFVFLTTLFIASAVAPEH